MAVANYMSCRGRVVQERSGLLETHALGGDGMGEFEQLGMQVEAVGGTAVKLVAKDGAAEAVGVGTVHAQLVSAPCFRVKAYAAGIVFIA